MSEYDVLERCKYAAFYYLERRMLTERELRDKLQKKEYPSDAIDQTVSYLKECGYINDTNYVELYTKDAVNLKKRGLSRVKRELSQKGVDREIIENTIDELEIDTSDMLCDLVKSKAQRLDLSDRKQRDRLIGFLLRRGFRYNEIASALRSYTDELEGEMYD